MRGVEYTVYLIINDVFKIPVFNQMITDHKSVLKLFGSVIYHKPHYIFKSKFYGFHNRIICLSSIDDIRMSGYFIGIDRYIHMRKLFLDTVSSAGFNATSITSKIYKLI